MIGLYGSEYFWFCRCCVIGFVRSSHADFSFANNLQAQAVPTFSIHNVFYRINLEQK